MKYVKIYEEFSEEDLIPGRAPQDDVMRQGAVSPEVRTPDKICFQVPFDPSIEDAFNAMIKYTEAGGIKKKKGGSFSRPDFPFAKIVITGPEAGIPNSVFGEIGEMAELEIVGNLKISGTIPASYKHFKEIQERVERKVLLEKEYEGIEPSEEPETDDEFHTDMQKRMEMTQIVADLSGNPIIPSEFGQPLLQEFISENLGKFVSKKTDISANKTTAPSEAEFVPIIVQISKHTRRGKEIIGVYADQKYLHNRFRGEEDLLAIIFGSKDFEDFVDKTGISQEDLGKKTLSNLVSNKEGRDKFFEVSIIGYPSRVWILSGGKETYSTDFNENI